ncbi:MAG: cupin domain-containing protein [Rhodovibrionaceae bacterium]|nr:cupin domain-containing protein [Rhodovibrionaceae bacterium]
MEPKKWHITMDEAAAWPVDPGERSARPLEHGTMHVHWYAPKGRDKQIPHDQDEIYIIAKGSGEFHREGERVSFQPGDVLFVAAGEDHRFENFSDDFATWVVFWGPRGGEPA